MTSGCWERADCGSDSWDSWVPNLHICLAPALSPMASLLISHSPAHLTPALCHVAQSNQPYAPTLQPQSTGAAPCSYLLVPNWSSSVGGLMHAPCPPASSAEIVLSGQTTVFSVATTWPLVPCEQHAQCWPEKCYDLCKAATGGWYHCLLA